MAYAQKSFGFSVGIQRGSQRPRRLLTLKASRSSAITEHCWVIFGSNVILDETAKRHLARLGSLSGRDMSVEILVEGPSDEAALEIIVPLIIPNVGFRIHAHQGKPDLLKKLPLRLRAYAQRAWKPRVVVLVDLDNEDCLRLKARLEEISVASGMTTKSSCNAVQRYLVVNRIAITELESWFFGDLQAVRRAFPKLRPNFESRKGYISCESIPGGAWEALEKELRLARYHTYTAAKIAVARRIAPCMIPQMNASQSFQHFCSGLRDLVAR